MGKEVDRAQDPQEQEASEARRDALEIYIAGTYRDLVQDPAESGSFIACLNIPRHHRVRVEKIMARPQPSVEEFEQAKTIALPVVEDFAAAEERVTKIVTPSTMALIQFLFVWLLFSAFPAMAAALSIRRGLVMQIFALTMSHATDLQPRDYACCGGACSSTLRFYCSPSCWRC